jgi:hypothetical protein
MKDTKLSDIVCHYFRQMKQADAAYLLVGTYSLMRCKSSSAGG